MKNQKVLFVVIAVVAVVIVLGSILSAVYILNLNKKNQSSQSANTSNIPQLTSYSIVCSSSTSNNSLTVEWSVPSQTSSSYSVMGDINDLSSSSSQPIPFGPVPANQGQYVFSSANGTDEYNASIYVVDKSGNKGNIVVTSSLNSSQCTSGLLPTAGPVATSTTSTTPTTTQTISATPTNTTSGTPTPSVTGSVSSLACNQFTLSQNGNTLTSASSVAANSQLTIESGITSSSSSPISYTNAVWSVSPTSTTLVPSGTSNSSVTFTPSSGQTYTISLAGVTDANGDTLSSPCTISISVGGTLPNTGFSLPYYILVGGATIAFGVGISLLVF